MFSLFYIPILYTIKTRLPSLARFVSWVIIYIVPVSSSFLYFHTAENFGFLLLKSVLGILLIYNIYEIGYIYNDTETIKKERNPTLRLSDEMLDYYGDAKLVIYLTRFIVSGVLTYFIYEAHHALQFLIIVWMLIPLYIAYNLIRSRLNIPLHFMLVTIRFCSVLFMFKNDEILIPFLMMMLIFPVINTLERCREERFNFVFLQQLTLNNKKDGRYKYYAILFLMSLVFMFISTNQVNVTFTAYTFYFFIYRLTTSRMTIK